jgi:hypothetical protein
MKTNIEHRTSNIEHRTLNAKFLWLALLVTCHLSLVTCKADFTVTVTPGYTFDPVYGPPPTYETLTLLGEPTITVSGTSSGTNLITPGSLTGASMGDDFPDGLYLTWNTASPRQLTALPGAWAGWGLMGTGTNVMVYVDPNYFQLATNSVANTNSESAFVLNQSVVPAPWLTLVPGSLTDTNIAPGAQIQVSKFGLPAGTLAGGQNWNGGASWPTNGPATNVMLGPGLVIQNYSQTFSVTNGPVVTTYTVNAPTVVLQRFTSGLFALSGSSSQVADVPHGLGVSPGHVHWVLQCQTADRGYIPGDEIDVLGVNANQYNAFTGGGNVTNVFLSQNGNAFDFMNKTNGSHGGGTLSSWEAKCYAEP